MHNVIDINGKKIGGENPCYIIAEMSANHNGNLENALDIIRAAKDSYADCVKIQAYTPDTMTIDCGNEYFMINEGTWRGETFYNLYKRAYTPWEWIPVLKKEAYSLGLDFLVTVFDKSSVDYAQEIGVDFYKIASFELTDIPLIEYVAKKGKPMIISTGMGTIEEIKSAVDAVWTKNNSNLCLLKCSSAYPANYNDMNLSGIKHLKEKFMIPVGFSDHSLGSLSDVTAVILGANVIEKHFCLDRSIKGPDSTFSMEPDEFKSMVIDIRNAQSAIGTAQFGVSPSEESSKVFRRSIFVVEDILKGDTFTKDNIRVIRPSYGLEPANYNLVIGKKSATDIKRGTPLRHEMIEE